MPRHGLTAEELLTLIQDAHAITKVSVQLSEGFNTRGATVAHCRRSRSARTYLDGRYHSYTLPTSGNVCARPWRLHGSAGAADLSILLRVGSWRIRNFASLALIERVEN